MSRCNEDSNRLLIYSGVPIWQHNSDLAFSILFARACKEIQLLLAQNASADAVAESLRKLSLQLRLRTCVDAANSACILDREFFMPKSKKYCQRLFDSTLKQCQTSFPIFGSAETLEAGGHTELAAAVKSQQKRQKNECGYQERPHVFRVGSHQIFLNRSSAEFGVQFDKILNHIRSDENPIKKIQFLKNLLESAQHASYYTVFASDGHGDNDAKSYCFKRIKDEVKEILRTPFSTKQSPQLLEYAIEVLGTHRDSLGFGNTNSLSDPSIQDFVTQYINNTNFDFDVCLECLQHIKDRNQLLVCVRTLAQKIQSEEENLKRLRNFIKESPVAKGRWYESSIQRELLQIASSVVVAQVVSSITDGIVIPKKEGCDDHIIQGVPIFTGQYLTLFTAKTHILPHAELKEYATIFCDWVKILFSEKYKANKIDGSSSDPIARIEKLKIILTTEEKKVVKEKVRMHYRDKSGEKNTQKLEALLSTVQVPQLLLEGEVISGLVSDKAACCS